MKKWISVILVISVLFGSAFWFALKIARQSVASEGYDTDEAAWNYLIRSGEIRFRLLDGSIIESLSFDGTKGRIKSSTETYAKLGYGNFQSTLQFKDRKGKTITLQFITSKFNNWNRVLYTENQDGSFSRYDNGVLEESAKPIKNLNIKNEVLQ